MEYIDFTKYLEILTRRKWWIIIPFLLTSLGGLGYGLGAQKIYEARTLILVVPQKVPEDYVRAIVTASMEDRLLTITQQVTSRTNLERIIDKFQLLRSSSGNKMFLEEKVNILRKRISINVSQGRRGRGGNSFTISFRGRDPEKVADVTNSLASNFISENLKIRESQALGTSKFLADELESVKKRLMEKEENLKRYRERYMGGMPGQLQTNLSILERLQRQLDQLHSNLRDAENRRIIIQTQIAEQADMSAEPSIPSASQEHAPRDITSLRNELASLEARYTENHPDVIRLRDTIAKLETERSKEGADFPEGGQAGSRVDLALRHQLRDIGLEIDRLKAQIKKTQAQVGNYQRKVEETPKREQELLSLNRDYQNLNELYNSLLNRKLEAEIAVSMEKKQKGVQFRVLDPAKVPSRPVEPDLQKLLLLTLGLGLGLGVGLAFLMEATDSSYKTPEEMEGELQLPVLMSMPIRYTEKELRVKKMKKVLVYAFVAVGYILSAAGIFVAIKGMDATLSYVNKILSNV